MLTSPNVRVRTDRVRITNASHDFSLLWYYGALAGEVEPQATGRTRLKTVFGPPKNANPMHDREQKGTGQETSWPLTAAPEGRTTSCATRDSVLAAPCVWRVGRASSR